MVETSAFLCKFNVDRWFLR